MTGVQKIIPTTRASTNSAFRYINTLYSWPVPPPIPNMAGMYAPACASDDVRAQEVLDTAYNLLQEQASRISDEEMRHSFLEEVPAHREILSEFAMGQ